MLTTCTALIFIFHCANPHSWRNNSTRQYCQRKYTAFTKASSACTCMCGSKCHLRWRNSRACENCLRIRERVQRLVKLTYGLRGVRGHHRPALYGVYAHFTPLAMRMRMGFLLMGSFLVVKIKRGTAVKALISAVQAFQNQRPQNAHLRLIQRSLNRGKGSCTRLQNSHSLKGAIRKRRRNSHVFLPRFCYLFSSPPIYCVCHATKVRTAGVAFLDT